MSQTAPPTPPRSPAPAAAAPPPPAAPPAPPPPPPLTKPIADRIVERFPSAKINYLKSKRLKVTIGAETAKDLALFARDELGFDHIAMVGGTDYPDAGEMEVDYFVETVSRDDIRSVALIISQRVKRDNPVAPTLVDVWRGVEYHERETFEMLGIRFSGHPDLRRLLLPEDWDDIPPLRKDYTSPGR